MAERSETTQISGPPAEVEAAELLDAVRGLAAQIGSLQTEIQSLRSGGLPPGEGGDHGWDDGRPARQDSPPWVRTLDSPSERRPPVPRLLLEIVFLIAIAAFAAIAGLDAPVIVAVMAGAWALVAAAEWAAAREAARREQALYASPFGGGILGEDPSWFGPPAERELSGAVTDAAPSRDTAAKLPPPPADD